MTTKSVGIVGISGYSGKTALEILLRHPEVRLSYVSANNTKGKLDDIWPEFKGRTDLTCEPFNVSKAMDLCELVILAVPHTVAMQLAPELLKAKIKVIDLSGDYRLKTSDAYKQWYGTDHIDSANLKKAVYGLPELYREDIKKAQLISNPGCYPTAAILGLAPLISTQQDKISSIAIDAKSGVSGAGRKATLNFSFGEVNENFKAYKILNHQHSPEIELYLSKLSSKGVSVHFVPHLLPITRGILETIYVQFNEKISLDTVTKLYQRFYKKEPFVRILENGQQPEIKNVTHTNFCDLGFSVSADGKMLVVVATIDNLVKGAAGQAIQNMNLMLGIKEETALL